MAPDPRRSDPRVPEFERRELPPEAELELADLRVREAAVDERLTMADPDTAPRPPDASEEPVTDPEGSLFRVEDELGLSESMFDFSDVDLVGVDGADPLIE